MGREAGVTLFNVADNFAGLAQAAAAGAEGVDQNPLIQAGITPEQLLVLANVVHGFGHQATMFPDPDTLGALSDRVNSKPGAYPLNIVIDQPEPPQENTYMLTEMVEMGRLAQLPILLSTQEQKDRFTSHPLVQQGLPSFVFIQVAAQEKTFIENAEFSDIARSLMEDEPGVFGTPEMREESQSTATPPFGMPHQPHRSED
jgi:hypothetical protein